MLCSSFPLCSEVEKMISKEKMHLSFKKYSHALVQPLTHASLKFTILEKLHMYFVTTFTCMYPDCPSHIAEGFFNGNNAFRLNDQHGHLSHVSLP